MGRTWTEDEIAVLLAWLDICIKHKIDFRETIANRLAEYCESSASSTEALSLKQAEQRLIDLARNNGGPHANRLASVKKYGSKCLPGLKDSLEKKMRRKFTEYERDIRCPKRRTTTDCAPIQCNTSDEQRLKTKPVTDGARPQTMAIAVTTTMQVSKSCPSVIINTGNRQYDYRNTESLKTSQVQQKIANNTIPQSLELDRERGLQTQSMRGTPTDPISNTGMPGGNTISETRLYEREVEKKDLQIRNMREEWQKEVYQLTQQQMRSTKLERDLRAQLKDHEFAAMTTAAAGRDPLEGTLFCMSHQLHGLNQRIVEMKKLVSFCQQTSQQSLDLSIRRMDEAAEAITSELESIFHGHDNSTPLLAPVVRTETDLGSLVRTMSGNCINSGDETQHLRRSIAKYGSEPEIIIRSLIVAAIRDWVFFSNFPNFDPSDSPMLDAYRRTVLTQDGWKCAHNLEMAAYHSLLEEPIFRTRELPQRAEELATRLSKALAQLFPSSPDIEGQNFDAWGQDREIVKSRKLKLTELFRLAIELKTNTILSGQLFEFMMYFPGEIDPGTPAKGGLGATSEMEAPTISYCSIRMYRAEPANPRDPLEELKVISSNFVASGNEVRKEKCLHSISIRILRETQNGLMAPASRITYPAQFLFQTEVVPRRPMNRSTHRTRTTGSPPEEVVGRGHLNNENHSHNNEMICDSVANDETDDESGTTSAEEAKASKPENIHECDICRARFNSIVTLRRHKHKKTCGCCSECSRIFRQVRDFMRHRQEAHDAAPLVTWNNARGSDGKLAKRPRLSKTSKQPFGVHRNLRAATPHVAETDLALDIVSIPSRRSDNNMQTRSTKQTLGVKSLMDKQTVSIVCARCAQTNIFLASPENHITQQAGLYCSSCETALGNQTPWDNDRCFEQGETNGVAEIEARTSKTQSSRSILSSSTDDGVKGNPVDQLSSPLSTLPDQIQDDIRLSLTTDVDGEQGSSKVEEAPYNSQQLSKLQKETTTPSRQGSSLRDTEPLEATGESFRCPICTMSFPDSREYKQHEGLHRVCEQEGHSRTSTTIENGEQASMCDRCGIYLEDESPQKKRKLSHTAREDVDMIHVSAHST